MKQADAERILLSTGWLAGQPQAIQSAVLRQARLVSFTAGERVFDIGDAAGGMYGAAAGGFGILVATDGRAARLAHVARAGIWFGHGPLMTGGPRVLGFRATEASVALHVPLAALQDVSRASLAGAQALTVLANANMGVAIATVSDLLIARADRRIAATLLRVTGAMAGMAPNDPAGFELTQADLGEMANASRQAVNRALGRFGAKGWIALGYRRVAIRDPAALAAFASPREEA